MADFINNLKYRFKTASLLGRLIYINIAVFIVLRLIGITGFLFDFDARPIINYIQVPSDVDLMLKQPWTLVTYMFAHYDVLHILFNMLCLWWFGKLFLEFFNQRQMTGLYLIGGLGGALIYLLAYNLLPAFTYQRGMLLGASASIMAIMLAVAVKAPNYKVGLLFIGEVSLKWIAIILIFLDFLSIDTQNAGGHISHIGGALTGCAYALAFRKGIDITNWLNKIIDSIVVLFERLFKKPRTKINQKKYHFKHSDTGTKTKRQDTGISAEDEKDLDEILKKIKQSGYSALSNEEKRRLFQISRDKNK